jgi:hypothetical protein
MHVVYEDGGGIVFDLYGAGSDTPHMIRTILNSLRMQTAPGGTADVHFHQGPQGQPTPCFDERCPNPRLEVV